MCGCIKFEFHLFWGGTEYVKFVSRSIIDFYNKEEYFK